MSHDHHDDELEDHPPLPADETVLWQGAPAVRPLAREAFHVRKLAIYFGVLAAWTVASGVADGESPLDLLLTAAHACGLALLGLGLVMFIAKRSARTTGYIITRRRVVLRIGIALPMTINIPLQSIQSVSVKLAADGSGNIALALAPGEHLAWLHLWPHARSWHFRHPEPTLRAVPDARTVASILATALDPTRQGSTAVGTALDAGRDPRSPFEPALS